MTARTRRGWLIAFVGLVFSAGVGTGVLLRTYLDPISAAAALPPRPSPGGLVQMFTKELDLTQAQQGQLERILLARRHTFGAFSEDIRQRMDAERDRTIVEIDKMLTPEQRVRFQAMNQKMREWPRPFPPLEPPLPPR
jgi:Spy/CpxP family protein refolding chaperone